MSNVKCCVNQHGRKHKGSCRVWKSEQGKTVPKVKLKSVIDGQTLENQDIRQFFGTSKKGRRTSVSSDDTYKRKMIKREEVYGHIHLHDFFNMSGKNPINKQTVLETDTGV